MASKLQAVYVMGLCLYLRGMGSRTVAWYRSRDSETHHKTKQNDRNITSIAAVTGLQCPYLVDLFFSSTKCLTLNQFGRMLFAFNKVLHNFNMYMVFGNTLLTSHQQGFIWKMSWNLSTYSAMSNAERQMSLGLPYYTLLSQ